jgi:hypothetical protein
MSRDGSGTRRYSEEEFALILKRASEIQESSRDVPGTRSGHGLSLDEIQAIAREVGIEPEAVSRAAGLLGSQAWKERTGLAAALFGGPGTYHLGLEVPGRLAPEEYSRILEVIRRVMEHQGEASEVMGGLEWKTVGELSAVSVNISPRGESTSIQVVGDRGGAGAVTFVFPVAGSAILMGALGGILAPESAPAIVALVGGCLGSGYLFARTLWARSAKKFQRRLTALMESLTGAVEGAARPGELPGQTDQSRPEI